MPPSPIRTHIAQSLDIAVDLSLQVVLNRHGRELRVQFSGLFAGQRADFGGRMDVVAGHEACGQVGSNAEEGFEARLYKEI